MQAGEKGGGANGGGWVEGWVDAAAMSSCVALGIGQKPISKDMATTHVPGMLYQGIVTSILYKAWYLRHGVAIVYFAFRQCTHAQRPASDKGNGDKGHRDDMLTRPEVAGACAAVATTASLRRAACGQSSWVAAQ